MTRDLAKPDVTPHPKTVQLARGERRYRRAVASPKRWQAIIDAKRGPCRVCCATGPVQFHHLVARVHGGGDTADNIVPLCAECHGHVTRRRYLECVELLETLTDAEYSYLADIGGETYAERAYGLKYDRTNQHDSEGS